MSTNPLHRILRRRHRVFGLLADLVASTGLPVWVRGADGRQLFGEGEPPLGPVATIGSKAAPLGTCLGPGAELAANLLGAFVDELDLERDLGAETLAMYREVNLLYTLADKLADASTIECLGQVVLEQAQRLMEEGSAAVWLLSDDAMLEVVASTGAELDHAYSYGEGILGIVIERRRAELVDDLRADLRSGPLTSLPMAMICAPLYTRRRPLGCIALVGRPGCFTSGDLKLLNAIAAMAGPAFEGVLTRDEQLREVEARERRARQEQEIRHLREINQVKDEVVRMASHDLKTPIGQIRGYTDLLRETVHPGNHEAFEMLEHIETAARRMSALVGNLLDLARIESDQQTGGMVCNALDLGSFVSMIAHEFAPEAELRGISLICEADPLDTCLSMDEFRLNQVVSNLVSNALKYTPQGGEVELSLDRTPDGWVHVHVRDTGLGIPDDSLPRLFERFYRVDDPSHAQQEGTGLGLAIVSALVSKHGGSIEVHSEVGLGSMFSVHLPEVRTPVPA